MKLLLFHDAEALLWSPFIETRPVGELLYGTCLLRERAERALGIRADGYLGAPHLEGFDEQDAPPSPAQDDISAPRVFLNVRAALEGTTPLSEGPATLRLHGEVVGWIVPAGEPSPGPEVLAHPASHARGEDLALAGELLERPWDLMAGNPARIQADVEGGEAARPSSAPPRGVHHLGDHALVMAEEAVVEPGVVIDLGAGPVWLDRGVRVQGPARLIGPLYVGPGSTILGGVVGTSSIGPVCKVRGEVADSVFLGWCNKAHDGHLGHALLGRWVNLGAGTINSDLKNTYSPVRVRLFQGEVDTDLLKVGCFLGDHVKTGIGTLINTGAVVGCGSNLFGGGMMTGYVSPFSWGDAETRVDYRLDRFLKTAEAAMRRREVELTPGMRHVLGRAAERGQNERKRERDGPE